MQTDTYYNRLFVYVVYVLSHVCEHVWVHMLAQMYDGQSLTSVFSLITLHDRYKGKISHLNSELADSASLAGWIAMESPCLHLLSTKIIDKLSCLPHIYLGAKNLNSGPHTYTCPHTCENASITHTNNLL